MLALVLLAAVQRMGYRLGDAVNGYEARWSGRGAKGFRKLGLKYEKAYPGSIAAEYLLTAGRKDDFDVLADIVRRRGELRKAGFHRLPQPDDIVVHLRLGDVLDMGHKRDDGRPDTARNFNEGVTLTLENVQYVKPRSYYEAVIRATKSGTRHVTLVGSAKHGGADHYASVQYREDVVRLFEAHNFSVSGRWEKRPDADFVWMAHATTFVLGGGGYSKLVGQVVKRLGGEVLGERL